MICRFHLKNALLVLIIGGLFFSQTAPAYPVGGEGYDYLSTGIGKESREIKVPQDFTVKMVFSSARGELLANVKVDVADEEGNQVFTTVSGGPWLFVDLPQGVYDITATFRNCAVKKEGVKISVGLITEVIMRWDLKGISRCD